MKTQQARVALGIALLLAGCSLQPATNVPMAASNSDPLGLGDAVAPRYTTLAAMAMPVAIANVSTSSEVTGFTASASSDRNPQFFAVSNLIDGNLHSAWGPAAKDAAPSVTLTLAQSTSLTGLGIKMDAGATFDVAVSNGGEFTTIATDITSEARALDFVNLTASTAQQVRLSFHIQPNAQLLVCEVKLFTAGNTANCFSLSAQNAFAESTIHNHRAYNLDVTGNSGTFTTQDLAGISAESFQVTGQTFDGNTLKVEGTGGGNFFAAFDATLTFTVVSRNGNTIGLALVEDLQLFHGTTKVFEDNFYDPNGSTGSIVQLNGIGTSCVAPSPRPTPGAQQCLGLVLTGDIFVKGTLPPVLSVNVNASQFTTGTFGTASIAFDIAADQVRGVVTGIVRAGNTVTISGSGSEFSNVGPIPGNFVITAKVGNDNGKNFTGTVTGVTFNGVDLLFGATITPASTATIKGTTADCAPSPLNCFSASGDDLFFPTGISPTIDVKLTNVVHSGATTTGAVVFTDLTKNNAKTTGKVTSASIAGNLVTLGGTLAGGGTFTLKSQFTDADNGTFGAAIVGIKEVNAAGKTLVDMNAPLPGNQGTGFSLTLSCN
jgi:hypothetical protein